MYYLNVCEQQVVTEIKEGIYMIYSILSNSSILY